MKKYVVALGSMCLLVLAISCRNPFHSSQITFSQTDTIKELSDSSEQQLSSIKNNSLSNDVTCFQVKLIAGQNIDVGVLKVWNDSERLFVMYELVGGWHLKETHLAIGSEPTDIPQTRTGNPIPGKFPFKAQHYQLPAQHTYEVNIFEVGFDLESNILITAHAEIVLLAADSSTVREDSAWSEGVGFDGANWARYFVYKIEDPSIDREKATYASSIPADRITVDHTTGIAFASNQLILAFQEDISPVVAKIIIATNGCSIVGEIPNINWYQLRIPDDETVDQMIQLFNGYAEVASAFHNTLAESKLQLDNPDPGLADQDKYLSAIQCLDAWQISTGIASVNIAVVDTGVYEVLDLIGKVDQAGYSIITRNESWTPSEPYSDSDHGTAVASVAAAYTNNGIGIAGVSWGARIIPIKIAEWDKASLFHISSGINAAIDRASELGIKIINVSWTSTPIDGYLRLPVVVERAYSNGILVVASLNNQSDQGRAYPAYLAGDYDNVISVAATDAQDNFHSGYGGEVSIGSPGTDIYAYFYRLGSWIVQSGDGTSLAAPIVSGVAALIWSLDLQSDGDYDLTPGDVKRIIMDTGDPTNREFKRVNAYEALLKAQEELGLSMPLYSTDFSTNPSWTTSDPSRFYWDSGQQAYFMNRININGGGNYAIKDTGVNMAGRSFTLEWDIKPVSVGYACDLRFGVYDTDMNSQENGSYVWVDFTTEDRGHTLQMSAMGSDSVGHGDGNGIAQWSPNTWYHVALNYNSSTGQLTAQITNRDSGASLRSPLTTTVSAFAWDMDRVGLSDIRLGNYQVQGAQAQGYVDNVRFFVY